MFFNCSEKTAFCIIIRKFNRLIAPMWKRAIRYGMVTSTMAGAGSYVYLHRKHQVGMVPSNTTYALNKQLSVPSRDQMINRMKMESFDLIVIGGGATGSGIAMDCATRGLKCALVEGDDWSSGTSSRSTKLLHGGVRYLEAAFKSLDVGQLMLVWESLEERAHMIKCAPYMSKPIPIIMPIYQYWQIPYCWLGVRVYDFLAKLVTCFDTGVPDCFYISRANSKFFFPHLKLYGLKGSLVYYDGQHNDSRMNMAIALNSTITDYVEGMEPAAIANHCEVVKVLKDENGKAVGVKAYDKIMNEKFDIFGKVVVNCTGPASDVIRKMADPSVRPLVTQASGSHAVLPKHYAPSGFGMIIPKTSDGRVLFFLPWEENTIIGTTDEKCQLTDLPAPTEKEIDWLLHEASNYVTYDYETMRKDLKSVWSGLRPLVKDPKASEEHGTAKLSRSHEIVDDPSGMVSVMGGKWTTYRRMAQDTLDFIIAKHKGVIEPKVPCRTKQMKLYPSIEASGLYSIEEQESMLDHFPRRLQEEFDLTYDQASYLVRNYGFLARKVCECGKKSDLLVPIQKDQPFLKAEILYCVRHEMAQTCIDVIARRIRVAFVDSESAQTVANEVADIMASELKWTDHRRRAEASDVMKYLNTMTLPKRNVDAASCPLKPKLSSHV